MLLRSSWAPGRSRLLARPVRLALRAASLDPGALPCVLAHSSWAPGRLHLLARPERLALRAGSLDLGAEQLAGGVNLGRQCAVWLDLAANESLNA